MAIPGKHARIRVMSETSTAFSTEPTSPNADYTIYTIDDRTKRYWDRTVTVQVFRNASPVPSHEYRLQPAGGRIHFREAQLATDDITVSGAFVTVVTAAETSEYTISFEAEVVDVSVLDEGLAGWRRQMPGIVGVSGTVTGFYNVDNLFTERLLQQLPLIIEMQPDNLGDEIFGVYAVMESQELSAAVEGAVETSVPWQSDGQVLIEQLA